MALKKTIKLTDNFDEEIAFADAYIKVSRIEGNKSILNIFVSVFKSDATKHLYTKPYQLVPSLSGDNFIAQAYAHLKTLPEFAGSVDV